MHYYSMSYTALLPKWWKFGVFAILLYFIIKAGKERTHYRSTHQLIIDYGYSAETHTVETEDGYLLDIYRIPYKRGGPKSPGPPVVILHGAFASSEVWLVYGPGHDLPLLLSDEGFDVWILNLRGNHNARLRENSTRKPEFSSPMMDELGSYDLPAILDYVILRTGRANLSFVGHSLGCMLFMTMTSLRGEYVKKVNHFVGIAPGAVLRKDGLGFGVLSLFGPSPYSEALGEFLVDSFLMDPRRVLRSYLCYFFTNMPYLFNIWKAMATYEAGISASNHSYLRDSCVFAPCGVLYSSMKQAYNFTVTGKLRRQDFGPAENLKRYNSTEAPFYEASHITTPSSFYVGRNDELFTHRVSFKTALLLPNVKKIHSADGMNHFDLIWPRNSTNNIFKHIVEDLRVANKMQPKLLNKL